jgi:hypothetical protein
MLASAALWRERFGKHATVEALRDTEVRRDQVPARLTACLALRDQLADQSRTRVP